MLCSLLKVSKSAYYQSLNNPQGGKVATRNMHIVEKMKAIHMKSYQAYGYRRMHAQLNNQGIACSKNKVHRLMALNKLSVKPKRRFVYAKSAASNRIVPPNRLQRNFNVKLPNTHWVSDITYIRTKNGWLYLAVIIDLYSRAVVGWHTAKHIDTALIINALNNAINNRKPKQGLVFHSDQGIQYTSFEFSAILNKHGFISSMSRRGNCWDNAVAESFFKSLKTELKINKSLCQYQQTNIIIQQYIDSFYNKQRLHSANGYMPPLLFEMVA